VPVREVVVYLRVYSSISTGCSDGSLPVFKVDSNRWFHPEAIVYWHDAERESKQ
jgi:hypothetical protein